MYEVDFHTLQVHHEINTRKTMILSHSQKNTLNKYMSYEYNNRPIIGHDMPPCLYPTSKKNYKVWYMPLANFMLMYSCACVLVLMLAWAPTRFRVLQVVCTRWYCARCCRNLWIRVSAMINVENHESKQTLGRLLFGSWPFACSLLAMHLLHGLSVGRVFL